jgi:hypothetical protein
VIEHERPRAHLAERKIGGRSRNGSSCMNLEYRFSLPGGRRRLHEVADAREDAVAVIAQGL